MRGGQVDGLHYADGRWCVEDNDFERYPAVSVWYERPDSLERIADEIEESDVDGCIDWANRIRKLAEKERVARCSHSCMSQ